MPPKKGKKSKKSKKSGKGNSKVKATMTPKEEILNYQILIKENILVDLKFEQEKLKECHDKILKKLYLFYSDKEHFTKEMIKKYHDSISDMPEKPFYKKCDVINSMKSNWTIESVEKEDILEMEKNIEIKETKIRELEQKLTSLQNIRSKEVSNNDQQIIVLKQVLNDMDRNFLTIKSYLEGIYTDKNSELLQKELLCTEKFEKNACIKASKIIKDDIKQEIVDNKWLRNKRDIHNQTFQNLNFEIEKIESENIDLNEKIFRLSQCVETFSKLSFSEIEPDDILFEDGLLEYNLNDVFRKNECMSKTSAYRDFKKINKMTGTESYKNNDMLYSSWKNYLNLNPVNFDFLYINGNLLNLKEDLKSEEEILEERFTIKTFPASLQSLNKASLFPF